MMAFSEIIQKKKIAPSIYDMILSVPAMFESGETPQPGQFVMLQVGKGEHLLPRPFGICDILPESKAIRLVFQVVGQGTEHFASLADGARLQLTGPLGNGFALRSEPGESILVGGGVGIPPLLLLAKALRARGGAGRITAVLGYRDKPFLHEDFSSYCDTVHIATDNGSYGFKGNAVELARQVSDKLAAGQSGVPSTDTAKPAVSLYACGPRVMLKALCDWSTGAGIPAQVSMEERMACGIGACVGCAVAVRQDGGIVYKRVCKDGPVFNAEQVVL